MQPAFGLSIPAYRRQPQTLDDVLSLEFAGDALFTNADTFCAQLGRNPFTQAGTPAQL